MNVGCGYHRKLDYIKMIYLRVRPKDDHLSEKMAIEPDVKSAKCHIGRKIIREHYVAQEQRWLDKIHRLLILSLAPGTSAAVVVKVLCQLQHNSFGITSINAWNEFWFRDRLSVAWWNRKGRFGNKHWRLLELSCISTGLIKRKGQTFSRVIIETRTGCVMALRRGSCIHCGFIEFVKSVSNLLN